MSLFFDVHTVTVKMCNYRNCVTSTAIAVTVCSIMTTKRDSGNGWRQIEK